MPRNLAPKKSEGYLIKDVVKAFEDGHVTELETQDRRYVVEWLRLTRPYMKQGDIAHLLGVTRRTISEDCAELDVQLKNTINDIDVGLILAEYGLQVKRQAQDIEAGKQAMEESGNAGIKSKTYLDFCLAIPKLYADWIGTLKSAGLVGEDAAPQAEYSYRTIHNPDGTISSEEKVTAKIDRDVALAQKKIKQQTGQYDADGAFPAAQLEDGNECSE